MNNMYTFDNGYSACVMKQPFHAELFEVALLEYNTVVSVTGHCTIEDVDDIFSEIKSLPKIGSGFNPTRYKNLYCKPSFHMQFA